MRATHEARFLHERQVHPRNGTMERTVLNRKNVVDDEAMLLHLSPSGWTLRRSAPERREAAATDEDSMWRFVTAGREASPGASPDGRL